jgi:hypothetical protein
MKATIQRIFVLDAALETHLKVAHRGKRAVIGNVFDDGETGAAVGAIDEWILIATVVWIKQFH